MLTVYPLSLSPSLSPMSSAGLTSPLDIWAGKSRNAKAQARHRAKRKAYIEQVCHTLSFFFSFQSAQSRDKICIQ